jgi:hypothetical protein
MKLFAIGLLVAGCGAIGDPNAPQPTASENSYLAGKWISQINDSCLMGINFGPGRAFSFGVVCTGGTPPIAFENSVGTYIADSGRFTATIAKTTCPNGDKAISNEYGATATSLTLNTPSEVILFERNTSQGGGSGVATLGCFNMGVFTPSPLAPL